MDHRKPNGFALLPLLVFLSLFIGTGTYLYSSGTDMAFYQLSATVAILPAIVLALAMGRHSFSKKITVFLKGVGDYNIITMCMIYLLAGAFAQVAQSIGGVESTVNLGLSVIPPVWVLPGLFLIAGFISTAMGTSMGTIAAIAPIAVGVADRTDLSLALAMGAVVGGAMFGDNLSMISDTTIAATRTQGCEMKDKFRLNLMIATPAALVTVVIFWWLGTQGQMNEPGSYQTLKVVPYILILVMAVFGIDVFLVLSAGILFTGIVGGVTVPDYSLLRYAQDIYAGFTGMQEILILSLFIGGLGELIRYHGGIAFILRQIDRLTQKFGKATDGRRMGEFGIASLVSFADLCTANNTVAILITGNLARDIARQNGVDPRRSASLLDIFSCILQGLIPYGAQILLAGSIAQLSPLAIVSNMFYVFILAAVAILAIIFGFPRLRSQPKR